MTSHQPPWVYYDDPVLSTVIDRAKRIPAVLNADKGQSVVDGYPNE